MAWPRLALYHLPFETHHHLPTLSGGFQGEGIKTIVPCRAFAKLAARLVPDQTPDEVRQAECAVVLLQCDCRGQLAAAGCSHVQPCAPMPFAPTCRTCHLPPAD